MRRLTAIRHLTTGYSESTVAQVLRLTNCIQLRDWPQVESLSSQLPEPLVQQCFTSRIQDWHNYNYDAANNNTPIPTRVALRFLAATDDPFKETYRFLVHSIAKGNMPHYQLVETYIWNLIVEERMAAVATILNIVLSQTTITLSNELWSVLISKICEFSDYPGGVIVYHELIEDPKKRPFLISPPVLETLLLIFATHNDYSRVQGIMAYFNDFYSFQLHPKTYKTLKIMLVEASASTDFITSLTEFRSLCLLFKGHSKLHWSYYHHLLKNTIAHTYTSRRQAIAENLTRENSRTASSDSDLNQQELDYATETNIKLFEPFIERNIYSTPHSNHLPLIHGVLRTSDIPRFYTEFHSHIKTLVDNEEGSRDLVETLRQRIIKTHYMLTICVVRLLCELGKFREALMLMETLGEKSMNYKTPFLIKEENFYIFAKTCDKYDLLTECFQFYLDSITKNNYKISPKVMSTFLSALLTNEMVRVSDIEHFLALYWKFGDGVTFRLPSYAWNNLIKKVDVKRFNFVESFIYDL